MYVNISFSIYICMYRHSDENLLKKNPEVISQSCHLNKFKLVNLTLRKTPNDVI